MATSAMASTTEAVTDIPDATEIAGDGFISLETVAVGPSPGSSGNNSGHIKMVACAEENLTRLTKDISDVTSALAQEQTKNRELSILVQQLSHSEADSEKLQVLAQTVTDLEGRIQAMSAEHQSQVEQALLRAKSAEALAADFETQFMKVSAGLKETQAQLKAMETQLEQAVAEATSKSEQLREAQREVEILETSSAESEEAATSSEAGLASVAAELHSQKAAMAKLEEQSKTQIQRLELELRKAAEMAESIECLRREEKRAHETEIWDLREQLEYATSSRRSLQNYVSYVKDSYRDVFERPPM
jgi:chromosome segregation ATPase